MPSARAGLSRGTSDAKPRTTRHIKLTDYRDWAYVITSVDAVNFSMNPNEMAHSDPEIVSGTPVFVGTLVPAQALLG
jgi:hypothetical protein